MLGVRYDALTLCQAFERVDAMLRAGAGGSIVTANSEMLLRCRRDGDFAAAVHGANLDLPDGIGVVYASRILGRALVLRAMDRDTLIVAGQISGVEYA